MANLKKRDGDKPTRPPLHLATLFISQIKQTIAWFYIDKPFLLIRSLLGLFYDYYLERWFYILFGIALGAWVAVETGLWQNFAIAVVILTLSYFFVWGNIIIWGAGRCHWIGKSFFVVFHVIAQLFVSSITVALPPFGVFIGMGYCILMSKFAPKYGNFEIRDRHIGGAKEVNYSAIRNTHINYIRQQEQKYNLKANRTMFLGIPLTDEEVTTSFIVFGEVRSGKSLILSMLMESLKEE